MRKLFLLPALVLSLSGVSASAEPKPRPAPEFAIHMPGSPDLRLSAYKGKVVLLALLNTGCTHCQHFSAELSELQKEYGSRGVQVLAAVFDNGAASRLKSFRDQYVKGFPVGLSDEATVMNWLQQPVEQGYFVPIVAFIDRSGVVRSQHMGDDLLFQDPEAAIRHKLDLLLKK